jgi:S-DNA-T family DNA segregation ATPase FtsK/SpoIIIE
MTTTDTEHGAHEAAFIDLAAYRDPETLDRIEQAAREAARTSPAGIADVTTGTVRLEKVDAEEVPAGTPDDEAGVLEILDEREGWNLRQIIPASFTDPGAWRQRRAEWTNAAAFHGVRIPTVYLYRAVKVAGVGAKAGARDAWSYLFATEYGDIADKVRRTKAGPEHIADLRMDRRKEAKARRREPVTVYTLTGCSTYVGALLALGQTWGWVMAAPILLPVFGVLYALGRRELIRREPDGTFTLMDTPDLTGAGVLTEDGLNDALRARNVGILKDGETVTVRGFIAREPDDKASVVRFALPRSSGKTAKEVAAKRDPLAAALAVDSIQLSIRQDGHEGEVYMRVADSHPFGGDAVPSPLIEAEQWDIWDGAPTFVDETGRITPIELLFFGLLVGAMPRQGKTFTARAAAVAAILDPTCRVIVGDGKGGKDWAAAALLAEAYVRGVTTAAVRRLTHVLEDLVEEMTETYDALFELPDEVCPEGKLTPEIVRDYKIRPVVLIIDEVQRYFENTDREEPDDKVTYGQRIEKALEDLAKVGPAAGLIPILASQKPTGDAVPSAIRDAIPQRIAHLCATYQMSDSILGTGSATSGWNAKDLAPAFKGMGIHADETGYRFMRSLLINLPQFRGVCERGRALRIAAGTLAGEAAGDGGRRARVAGILADLLAVFEDNRLPERLATAEILDGLAVLDPGTWAPAALGVGEDDRAAYVRTGGTALRKAIDEALDGSDRTLAVRSWTSGGRANGYYLDDVRKAAGIA